jgi:hypothetical protein
MPFKFNSSNSSFKRSAFSFDLPDVNEATQLESVPDVLGGVGLGVGLLGVGLLGVELLGVELLGVGLLGVPSLQVHENNACANCNLLYFVEYFIPLMSHICFNTSLLYVIKSSTEGRVRIFSRHGGFGGCFIIHFDSGGVPIGGVPIGVPEDEEDAEGVLEFECVAGKERIDFAILAQICSFVPVVSTLHFSASAIISFF